ncbi:hypothetical protein FQR65_LT03032 [Abscondita terminalis]|nr:hypothetical protein FQR65_LT03032 [Abscondita terminalis]
MVNINQLSIEEPDYRRERSYNSTSVIPSQGDVASNQRVHLRPQQHAEPDYRRNGPYDSSSTPVPIGFTEPNQRVPLRPERFSGSMPMPNTRVRSILNPISGSNPYPPISFATSRPNPSAPLQRQHSSSADDLPPSYNVAVLQETRGDVAYTQPVANSNVTVYPEIHVPIPYQHAQPNISMGNNFPQPHPHQNLQQQPGQFCGVRDDLPPTYSEAVSQNYYTK